MGTKFPSAANLVSNQNLKGCTSFRILKHIALTSLLGCVNISPHVDLSLGLWD